MKSTGWRICFLSSRAWSSSQFVRRWRYQFTGLLAVVAGGMRRRERGGGGGLTCGVDAVAGVLFDVVVEDL